MLYYFKDPVRLVFIAWGEIKYEVFDKRGERNLFVGLWRLPEKSLLSKTIAWKLFAQTAL